MSGPTFHCEDFDLIYILVLKQETKQVDLEVEKELSFPKLIKEDFCWNNPIEMLQIFFTVNF